MDAAAISTLLAKTAYQAYSLSLDGALRNNSDAQKYYDLVRAPTVGQIVVEASTIYRSPGPQNIGRLISITLEPLYTQEEWADEEGPIPQQKVWTIELLHDGSLFKWTNCTFIAVPEKFI